jgi:glucose/arabinose dehydrogenase
MGIPLGAGVALAAPELPDGLYLENAAPGSKFVLPVAAAFASDGRIFVAEKRGIVWVIQNGEVLPQPFIDLRSEVMSHYDRGLLGMTLHPQFDENGYVYLLYTVDHDGTGSYSRVDVFSRLTRYSASTANPNVADLGSRHILLGETFREGIPACSSSHAIGTVVFGGDGMLLVGSGDAASFDEMDDGGTYVDCFGEDRVDPAEDIGAFRSQYLGSLAGKILRIDPETGHGRPGNPFYAGDPTDIRRHRRPDERLARYALPGRRGLVRL